MSVNTQRFCARRQRPAAHLAGSWLVPAALVLHRSSPRTLLTVNATNTTPPPLCACSCNTGPRAAPVPPPQHITSRRLRISVSENGGGRRTARPDRYPAMLDDRLRLSLAPRPHSAPPPPPVAPPSCAPRAARASPVRGRSRRRSQLTTMRRARWARAAHLHAEQEGVDGTTAGAAAAVAVAVAVRAAAVLLLHVH